ncbi:YesL family protein [Bacillus sp. ISL-46]|uniref:YesL family protein n=1 Tax=Bacillus sp. ISL-46 TaxID=2819129 RepID=UPI001BE9C183|nr:DUF624 domain-containing protein [Bacillus sp. ISL-46]MBT2722169.1 DUF624 domain-containing protein [Bacillus sp. ISL-46]
MNFMNSKVYSTFEVVCNLFLLNLLWLLMSLPVVTIFPATAAMFGVVRQSVLYKDSSVFTSFFRYFKENFKQSFLLGILWLTFAYIFYSDYKFIYGLGSIRNVLLPVLLFVGVLYTFTTVFLFPVMVHYKTNWRVLLKNALFFSLLHFPITLLGLVILVATAVIAMALPITGFIIFSISAYWIFSLCNRVFRKIEQVKVMESVN